MWDKKRDEDAGGSDPNEEGKDMEDFQPQQESFLDRHLVRQVTAQRIQTWLEDHQLSYGRWDDPERDYSKFEMSFRDQAHQFPPITVSIHLEPDAMALRVIMFTPAPTMDRLILDIAANGWNSNEFWPTCYSIEDEDGSLLIAGSCTALIGEGLSNSQLEETLISYLHSGSRMFKHIREEIKQLEDIFSSEGEEPDNRGENFGD
ncbi:MAG: YbjN domain-containing protein [Actinomycetaceae bacterium]|nr:YbjN domain-containing protein [Actinomycetaceae bacterium]